MMDTIAIITDYIAAALTVTGSAVKVLLYFLPFIAALFAAVAVLHYRDDLRDRRLSSSRIGELDYMSAGRYKKFVLSFLRLLGYTVEEMPGENRRGRLVKHPEVDALAEKDGSRYAVVARKWDQGMGTHVLVRLERTMQKYGCSKAIIVNNGVFEPVELEEGEKKGIELWDREKLIKELLRLQGREDPGGRELSYYVNDFWKWLWGG